jgi:hypothetical protein
MDMISVEATRILLDYKDQLEKEIISLRAEACRLALIKRMIEKTISIDDIKELENWKLVQEAYSLKNVGAIIFNKE